MIKFFRKIRQNLLLEGKTASYLKYAIGEIVLVVIGILIALQINNWNSGRLQSERNMQLLFKMSKELNQHKERIEGLLNANAPTFKSRLIKTDSVYHILEIGIQPKDLDYFNNVPFYYNITLNLHTIVFEELLNTGSLYSLGSDSLVTTIQNYYKMCEKQEFYNLDIGKAVVDLSKLNHDGFFDFVYWYKRNPEKAIALHSWIFEPESDQYRIFRQYMGVFRGHSNMMVDNLTRLLGQCNELKSAIDTEIEKP